jgi:DNA-binding response OmpR family regulator
MPDESSTTTRREIPQPGIGIGLCAAIRSFDQHTPSLVLLRRRYEADIKVALSAGANMYAAKPFDREELLRIVGDLIKTKARGAR